MMNLGTTEQIHQDMRQCIDNCTECHSICLTTVPHCLNLGGMHASKNHITILLDCAEICQTSANFMLRNSPMHGQVCGVCAEACENCADDCERLADGDAQMLACAEVCRRCAESCRHMARIAA